MLILSEFTKSYIGYKDLVLLFGLKKILQKVTVIVASCKQHKRCKTTIVHPQAQLNLSSVQTVPAVHTSLGSKPKLRASYYITDPHLANVVADAILINQSNKSAFLLETNPGPGVLTQVFLSKGVKNIVAVETRNEFLPGLKELQSEIGKTHFHIFHLDLFTLWRRDSTANESDLKVRQTESEIKEILPQTSWNEAPPVVVYGVLSVNKEVAFLHFLIDVFALHEGLFSAGRLEWFLFVSPRIYRGLLACLDNTKHVQLYNKLFILFHTFFDVKHIMKVPGSQFCPAFPTKRRRKPTQTIAEHEVNFSERYLVQLTPKKNIHNILPAHDISRFNHFLKQVLYKKTTRLIPKMEQLVPGCGIHLIRSGFTMIHTTGQLDSQQLLRIFKDMLEWPEYQDSGIRYYFTEKSMHSLDEEIPESVEEKVS